MKVIRLVWCLWGKQVNWTFRRIPVQILDLFFIKYEVQRASHLKSVINPTGVTLPAVPTWRRRITVTAAVFGPAMNVDRKHSHWRQKPDVHEVFFSVHRKSRFSYTGLSDEQEEEEEGKMIGRRWTEMLSNELRVRERAGSESPRRGTSRPLKHERRWLVSSSLTASRQHTPPPSTCPRLWWDRHKERLAELHFNALEDDDFLRILFTHKRWLYVTDNFNVEIPPTPPHRHSLATHDGRVSQRIC